LLNRPKRKKRSNLIKLIAGLGNPGVEYEKTRHNVGFLAIGKLLEISPAVKKRSIDTALLFETRRFGLLCKPLTFMNHSGKAIAALSKEMDLQPEEILVIYDDFALELGMIRIRAFGSAGTHNGVQSIIDHLGSTKFPRIRMGIQTVVVLIQPLRVDALNLGYLHDCRDSPDTHRHQDRGNADSLTESHLTPAP